MPIKKDALSLSINDYSMLVVMIGDPHSEKAIAVPERDLMRGVSVDGRKSFLGSAIFS